MKELRAACEVLGLAPGSLTVHRSPSLPDSPYKGDTWLFSEVAHVVVAKAKEIQAGAVVTFDADGVTGHPNHVACRCVQRVATCVRMCMCVCASCHLPGGSAKSLKAPWIAGRG